MVRYTCRVGGGRVWYVTPAGWAGGGCGTLHLPGGRGAGGRVWYVTPPGWARGRGEGVVGYTSRVGEGWGGGCGRLHLQGGRGGMVGYTSRVGRGGMVGYTSRVGEGEGGCVVGFTSRGRVESMVL